MFPLTARRVIMQPGIFRLFLAIVVVVHHASRLALGAWAVNVFFILSGYWVTQLFRTKHSHSMRSTVLFYFSRYARLFPVYCVCLVIMVIFTYSSILADRHALTVGWVLRSLTIVSSAGQYQPLVPAWSLDIEMQFYLALPVLLLLISRIDIRWRNSILLIVSTLLIPLTWLANKPPFLFAYFAFFLVGILIALTDWKTTEKRAIESVCLFFFLLVVMVAIRPLRDVILGGAHAKPTFVYNQLFSSLAAILVLPYVAYSLRLKSSPIDRHLGNLAYPLYLVHWMPHRYFSSHYGLLPTKQRLIFIALELIVDAIAALLIYVLIDQPCERWRYRITGRLKSMH